MVDALPQDLSAFSVAWLHDAVEVRDERLSVLFRRWPALSALEIEELATLYEERLRVAKHLGTRRAEAVSVARQRKERRPEWRRYERGTGDCSHSAWMKSARPRRSWPPSGR
jgi:hypothetical protein